MSPYLLLTLWRERWGKPSVAALQVPYLQGLISRWMERFAHARPWSLPGLTLLVVLLCSLLLVVLLPVQFTRATQVEFSVALLIVALYLRSYEGTQTSLVLMGLSLLVSTRYFYWRLGSTLGQELDAAFLFGLTLCAAELYCWLRVVLVFVAHLWPIKQEPVPMQLESGQWPSVDLFILCANQSLVKIESAAQAAMGLAWPEGKIKTFLLDDAERQDVRVFATSMGVNYVSHAANTQGQVGNLNRALPESQAEFIALFECAQAPDVAILKKMATWFDKDANLAMIQTPVHFLAPAPSGIGLELFDKSHADRSFAMIRRSLLVEADGIEAQPQGGRVNLARQLQAKGYVSAYLGMAQPIQLDKADHAWAGAVATPAEATLFLVELPISNRVLTWKLRLVALQAMLSFYAPLPRLIFMLAPLPYLLGGINIIQAPIGLLAAYALPHLLHGHLAQARTQGLLRLTGWVELRQTWVASSLLVLTALTLVRTEILEWMKRLKARGVEKKPAFEWTSAYFFGIVLLLNLTGLAVGLARWSQERSPELEIEGFYLLWSLFNLLLLAARAAVNEEARQIQYHQRLQIRRPAMIQLPLGRSLSCVTENFPEKILSLKLPVSMPKAFEVGSPIRLSLFQGDREFTFPAEVTSIQDRSLHVRILDAALANYQQLSEATRSRARGWPQWLPGRHADRFLSSWIGKVIITLRSGFRDLKHLIPLRNKK